MFDNASKHLPTDIRQEFRHDESMNPGQADKVAHGQGFVAALDQKWRQHTQSGGSTPKALRLYGLSDRRDRRDRRNRCSIKDLTQTLDGTRATCLSQSSSTGVDLRAFWL